MAKNFAKGNYVDRKPAEVCQVRHKISGIDKFKKETLGGHMSRHEHDVN